MAAHLGASTSFALSAAFRSDATLDSLEDSSDVTSRDGERKKKGVTFTYFFFDCLTCGFILSGLRNLSCNAGTHVKNYYISGDSTYEFMVCAIA